MPPRHRILRTALILIALLGSHAARAQLCTASATNLAFGIYDPSVGSPSDITASITVSCSAVVAIGVSYSIQISAGTGSSVVARSMAGSRSRLAYQLYADAAHTAVWGDGTGGSTTVNDGFALAVLANVTRTYTAYGRIPAAQRVPPDIYSDLLTVLIVY